MDHVVCGGHGAIRVGDDREVDVGVLGLVDIFDPSVMILERIDTDGDRLDAALLELWLELGSVAEFSGADRRVVRRVGEQDRPAIADPLVEVDVAFSCLRLKIRSLVA